ncbi:unnamed protein product, partial [marine sediment metagenome]
DGRPVAYSTRKQAVAEIDYFIDATEHAVASGDMDCPERREEYRPMKVA